MNVHDGSIEGLEIKRSLAAFTIGLSSVVDGPELIFVDEESETVSKFIDRYLFYRKMDIPLEELVNFTKLGDSPVQFKVVKQEVASKYTSQMFEYFKEKDSIKELPEVVWIGRKSGSFPFFNIDN